MTNAASPDEAPRDPTWLDGGRLPAALVADLFFAAAVLWPAAPGASSPTTR